MPEKLLTVREASEILGILEKEIIELARKGKLSSYLVGGEFLRFPRNEILNLKGKIRREFNVQDELIDLRERVYNFFYFYDFYVLSFLIIAVLLGIILFT